MPSEKYKKVRNFSVPIEKEVTKIDKDGKESVINISYKIKFIDSARFIVTSLSNLVDNLAKGNHKIKCEDCDCFLKYENVKDDLIIYKRLSCNKDYSNKIDEELKKRFKNTFKFSNNVINKFVLLLRNGVYPYEYMDDWEKFNETTLPEKEEFYSNLNMEDITDADYMHPKRVRKDFAIKNLGGCHDLYLKSETLLLADVFENFRKMCLKTLDPAKFLSAPGLARQAALKKTDVKLESLTDIDKLLMVEKEIRGVVCHAIHRYAKADHIYMKDYTKNKESLYLKYWDVNNLYGWAMSQKLPVNNFEWIEYTYQFNEDFIQKYNEESDEGYFLAVDVQYPEKVHELHNDLPLLPERMKFK